MFAVAITIAALLALIVGVLAVPVVVVIDIERGETSNAQWQVSWFFGLLNIRSTKEQSAASPAPEPVERRARVAAKRRKGGRRVGLAAWNTRGFVRRVAQLAMDLFRQAKFERLHVDATFGFENPADTGFVYGCLSPVLVLAGARGLDIRCAPTFLDFGVRGSLGATIHVRPLSIVGTMTAFLVSPPVVRTVWAVWRTRT